MNTLPPGLSALSVVLIQRCPSIALYRPVSNDLRALQVFGVVQNVAQNEALLFTTMRNIGASQHAARLLIQVSFRPIRLRLIEKIILIRGGAFPGRSRHDRLDVSATPRPPTAGVAVAGRESATSCRLPAACLFQQFALPAISVARPNLGLNGGSHDGLGDPAPRHKAVSRGAVSGMEADL
jgi:hypothetical protein